MKLTEALRPKFRLNFLFNFYMGAKKRYHLVFKLKIKFKKNSQKFFLKKLKDLGHFLKENFFLKLLKTKKLF